MQSQNNYIELKERVAEISQRCGRDPNEIMVIPVTKYRSWDEVQPIYDAGCREFAESRMQEALLKVAGAPDDIRWHLIGTLQKNKVRKAIGSFVLIHSVDTFDLAQKISQCSQEMSQTTAILLQVNNSGELTKHGMSQDEWLKVFDMLLELPNLDIQGLMTMAPLTKDEAIIRRCFAQLYTFREKLQVRAGNEVQLKHLSMGMSQDYPIAIEEGATLLRMGSACFTVKS